MPLVENATIRKLRAGGIALGFGVHHLRTAAAGMIAAATGHDWLFIDMEHGAFSQDDVAQICIAALPTGITPIVRVCVGALDVGTRALDNGARASSYRVSIRSIRPGASRPPFVTRLWDRGAGADHQLCSATRRRPTPTPQRPSTRKSWWSAIKETPKGWRNPRDGALPRRSKGSTDSSIGTSDLTAEMGISGQILHPRVVEAYRHVGAACRKAGNSSAWAASMNSRP